MSKIFCKCPWGMTLLRVVIGIVFLAHGVQKLQGIDGTIGFFASLGMSAFFAYLVAWVETVAGIALIVGLMTTIASYLLAIIMVVAIFTVKAKIGLVGGYELDLVLLAGLLTLAWSKASPLSLDKMAYEKCKCGGKCIICMGANGAPNTKCDGCENCKNVCSGHEMK